MSANPEALARQLHEQQYLYLPGQLNPERCRLLGTQIINHTSFSVGETDYHSDDTKSLVRKISLGPFYLGKKLPLAVDMQDEVLDILGSLGIISVRWGQDTKQVPRGVLGLQVLPGGGFYMHRDRLDTVEVIALVGLLAEREFTIVPSRYREVGLSPKLDLPPPVVVGEGDILLLDAWSRPWHQTINATEQVGITMAMTQRYSASYKRY